MNDNRKYSALQRGISSYNRLPDIGRNCIIEHKKSRMKNRNYRVYKQEMKKMMEGD